MLPRTWTRARREGFIAYGYFADVANAIDGGVALNRAGKPGGPSTPGAHAVITPLGWSISVNALQLALVVGGSGLYIKALTHGLSPLPAVDAKLRAELNALSLDELNAWLASVDPLGAAKNDRKNKGRVVRARELVGQTNGPGVPQGPEGGTRAVGWSSNCRGPAAPVIEAPTTP